MDIEVEGRADLRMTKEDAEGLVVAFAFDAAGREAVAQAVELEFRHAELSHETVVIIAVCARFDGLGRVRENIETIAYQPLEGPQNVAHVLRDRYGPHRIHGLCGIDDDFGMAVVAACHIYPLDRLRDPDHAGRKVDVLPFQSAYLADPKARTQADVDAQVHETEIVAKIAHDPLLMADRKHLELLPVPLRREPDIDLAVDHVPAPHPESQHHLQHDQQVLDCLAAKPGLELHEHKLLDHILGHIHLLPESGNQMFR